MAFVALLLDLDHASMVNFIKNPTMGNVIENRIKYESKSDEFIFLCNCSNHQSYVIMIFKMKCGLNKITLHNISFVIIFHLFGLI